MKCCELTVCCLLLATLTTWVSAQCDGLVHSSSFGERAPYDQLDFMDRVQEEWKLLRVIEKTVSYPLEDDKPNLNMITYIEITDLLRNGKNGCAYLLKGGPGYNYTDILFKSKRNQGIDMLIKIFIKKYF